MLISAFASRVTLIAMACACAIGSVQAASSSENTLSYSWIEGGAARMDVRGDLNRKFNGGYLSGSWDIGNHLYLLGSYNKTKKDWKEDWGTVTDGTGTFAIQRKLNVDLSQATLGVGGHYPLAEQVDLFGDLSAVRLDWDGDIHVTATDTATGAVGTAKGRDKDHVYGGKLSAGVRAKPFTMLELWGKAGYTRMDDNQFVRENAAVGNAGVQFLITPNLGLVGETEVSKDLRLYRAGLRFNF